MFGLNLVQLIGLFAMFGFGAAYVFFSSPQKTVMPKPKDLDVKIPSEGIAEPTEKMPPPAKSRSMVLVEIDSLLSFFERTDNAEGVKAMQDAAIAALAVPVKTEMVK